MHSLMVNKIGITQFKVGNSKKKKNVLYLSFLKININRNNRDNSIKKNLTVIKTSVPLPANEQPRSPFSCR